VMDVDVSFNINGNDGGLSGMFYFSSPDDTVYINWTVNESGVIGNFSVEGSSEFSVEDFVFWFGDMISVSVERFVGSFDLSSGGSVGMLVLVVDDSFVDVDVYVELDLGDGENLTLSGVLDVVIDGEADGTLWLVGILVVMSLMSRLVVILRALELLM